MEKTKDSEGGIKRKFSDQTDDLEWTGASRKLATDKIPNQ